MKTCYIHTHTQLRSKKGGGDQYKGDGSRDFERRQGKGPEGPYLRLAQRVIVTLYVGARLNSPGYICISYIGPYNIGIIFHLFISIYRCQSFSSSIIEL